MIFVSSQSIAPQGSELKPAKRCGDFCCVCRAGTSTWPVGVDHPITKPMLSARVGSPLRPQWRRVMAVTKDQVLQNLAKVASPDGTPLSATDALSDVVVTDG